MRRKRFRKPVTNMSLFPFIAVLICTMGALIVLLVLFVQQARVQADTICAEREKLEQTDDEERKHLLQEQEDLDWQREILEQQRAELNETMTDGRLQLSHLEDHIRRLEANLKRLQAEAGELRRLQQAGGQESATRATELQGLREEIQRERERLDAARDEAAGRRRSFSIIAYRGPNGTRRRPIYIECSKSGIVIQPEGVVLSAEDFTGPLGPGNPLDAVLRAIREHWKRVEGDSAKGEPYPLLVVRPDGAIAYSMARAAMTSWDDEFGYELIDGQMELAFPPSDPTLKRILDGAVRTARQRQAILAAAMPSRFDGSEPASFSVPDRPSGSMDSRRRAGIATGGFGAAPGEPRNGFGDAQRPGSELAAAAGNPDGPQDAAAQPTGGAEGSSEEEGSCSFGDAAGDGAACPGGANLQSMATSKGANWALPKEVTGLTVITRPIVVECHTDRLVIRPDRGDKRTPTAIPMKGATQGAIAPFVSAIHAHMKRWGMAVAGGYWKPVARIEVLPGAEWRFNELKTLLQGSGIQVEER